MKTGILIFTFFFALSGTYAQSAKDYTYLPKCYKGAEKDRGKMDIAGIGTVNSTALAAEGLQSPALTYFEIPKDKQAMKPSKVAKAVADYHINAWKSNSKKRSNRQYHEGKATINDLRLHLNTEDTDVQIVIISDGNMVYELMSFQGDDKKDNFDALLVKVRQHQCP